VRLITPGIYTTFDGEYRVEKIRLAGGDPSQDDQWDVYRQHEPGVTLDTLDQRATAISAGHDSLAAAIAALAAVCGESQVVACIKECAFIRVPARDLRPGQLVDLDGDEFADHLLEPRRYEWELTEVCAVERETAACIRVDFENDSVGFPPAHELKVLDPGVRPPACEPGDAPGRQQ
jgi:hypothetical protein